MVDLYFEATVQPLDWSKFNNLNAVKLELSEIW